MNGSSYVQVILAALQSSNFKEHCLTFAGQDRHQRLRQQPHLRARPSADHRRFVALVPQLNTPQSIARVVGM